MSEGLKAELVKTGEAALSNAVKDFEGEQRQRTVSAEIKEDLNVVVNDQVAMAERIETLTSNFESDIAITKASVSELARVTSTADSALAKQISQVSAEVDTATASLAASIQEEATARADADAAQASVTDTIQASFQLSGEAALANALGDHGSDKNRRVSEAVIYRTQKVFADNQQAFAIDLFRLDVKFSSNVGELQASLQEEKTVRATADSALAESINTVKSRLNGTTATVQQHSLAIVDLENGAQAMWSVKAQAGDITAGIGIIADQATGKSQVMVNASQFFVFDNAVGKTAIFAIDQGQVIIRDAVIRKATIDIVNAMSITADTIKANASITSPNISGGTLNIGGGNFQVNSAGTMTLRSGPGNTGMVLNNSRLDVYDDAGVLRVRIGLL